MKTNHKMTINGTPKTICGPQGKPPVSWRDRLDGLPPEHRTLVEGGSLSQRFSKQPLSMTHPVFIGGFYGLLVAMALLLPFVYEKGWNQDTMRDWAFLGVLLMLISAITGHFSLIIAKILRRPPISLRRMLVYPLPFLGLTILSVILVTDIESELSDSAAMWTRYIGWMLLLIPGPVYVHLSWAPRWRLLCRLEEGLDPFDGDVPPSPSAGVEGLGEDSDMKMAIEDIEEDPPILHVSDGDE
ncbi:MAG: hypothetical protein OSB32_05005 [Candidatus Poseidoniales archaeon]|nr:hypothetical protein [Candidatus Poseidoniales archaeon]